jgi:hypothetical protein
VRFASACLLRFAALLPTFLAFYFALATLVALDAAVPAAAPVFCCPSLVGLLKMVCWYFLTVCVWLGALAAALAVFLTLSSVIN